MTTTTTTTTTTTRATSIFEAIKIHIYKMLQYCEILQKQDFYD